MRGFCGELSPSTVYAILASPRPGAKEILGFMAEALYLAWTGRLRTGEGGETCRPGEAAAGDPYPMLTGWSRLCQVSDHQVTIFTRLMAERG